jgi:hypothetical protein
VDFWFIPAGLSPVLMIREAIKFTNSDPQLTIYKMKTHILILLFVFVAAQVLSQSNIQKTVKLKKGQKVILTIDDANLINIKGWDEDHMEINAMVLINNGNNNDSYQILIDEKTGNMHIQGFIQNKDKLPRMIQIKKGGQLYSFNTDNSKGPEIMKFYEEHGRDGIQWTSHGVMWDINYEIRIPKGTELEVSSRFGIIDIDDFEGNLQANSKHGGVDIAVESSRKMDFNLKSDWGEIFTNLNLNFNSGYNKDNKEITCSLNGGGGLFADLESKHGNIYIRSAREE